MKGLLFQQGYPLNLAVNAAASAFKQQVRREFGEPHTLHHYELHWHQIRQYYLIGGDILWVPADLGNELWLLLSAPDQGRIVDVDPAEPWKWTEAPRVGACVTT